ncbi:ATP-dependent DNA helicase RecG [Ruminococcus flavefaciens]|uniref:ATP-dependent DNA helicase RecG n=1 Tax=Ruminococcus flavefaciens TaxID=1265 RepID=UPI002A910FA2|nr:ATP-dependent DNA helicase RecG [Ruminococcus flavefaciens]MDY5692147.1 ATP-dependent DNA helicase RecG [Ruminococcus flavefaciens]
MSALSVFIILPFRQQTLSQKEHYMPTTLFSDIEYLKGVGKARGEKYRKLGINSPYELIYHIPRDYLDFRTHVPVQQAVLGDYNVLKLTVYKKMPPQRIKGGLVICKAAATDGMDDILIVVYNNVYYFQALKEGETYYMYGKVAGNFLRKEISSPVYIRADEKVLIQPKYHLTQGLSVNMVRTNMRQALELMRNEPFETLSADILRKYDLCPLMWALENIHFPESELAAETARRRLAFDELLKLQIGMSVMKSRSRRNTAFQMDSSVDVREFTDGLPFELTDDQKKAAGEIVDDLCRNVPMNRLLQGDVGSGKTAVAAAACYFSAKNGVQSALMAPTEILASQHFNTLSGFLEPFGVKVCLLTGSMTARKKADIREQIAAGEIDVIVGTHAIIQKDVEYKSLGLVITDEQHRFGVAQRAALAEKGDAPHKLVMSATPIPRTLALIIYGDLDISAITQLPKGRKPVRTYAVTGKLRSRAFGFVRERLDDGRQAYVVCPMIEESESELFAVKTYAEEASKGDLKGYTTALLHGKMRAAEKDKVMEKFRSGEIQVLICTTVVEVGVDVPNAAVMVIENAERFGLSQLHQLRGRVGRGSFESSCILITDNTTDDCVKRMKIMSSTSDGFKISEEDLKMRGPGDFFGNAQHGLPPLKIADIACNMELMNRAQNCAKELLEDDPMLEKPQNRALKLDIMRLFNRDIIG